MQHYRYLHTVEEKGNSLPWQLLPPTEEGGGLRVGSRLKLPMVEQVRVQLKEVLVRAVVLHQLCNLATGDEDKDEI